MGAIAQQRRVSKTRKLKRRTHYKLEVPGMVAVSYTHLRVFVMHSEMEWINKAIEIIENLTREPVVGQIYPVKVVKIVDFGAFVELWPGCEGLVHLSELDLKRVAKVEDVVHVGDEIVIKLLKIDDKGKLVLSRKAVLKQNVKPSSEEEKPENTEEKHDTESNTEDYTK